MIVMGATKNVTRTTCAFKPTEPTCKYLWHLLADKTVIKKTTEENVISENGTTKRQLMEKEVKGNVLLTKLKTFLMGGLWCARLDTFGDDLEGALPDLNKHLLKKLLRGQAKLAIDMYKKAVQRSFASCWHMSDGRPSSYMWDEFGSCSSGLAIQTTPQLLEEELKPISGDDGPTYIGQVEYIDHGWDVIDDGNMLEAHFVVRDEYEQECEARVLIHSHGGCASNCLAYEKGLFGKLVVRPPQAEIDAGHGGFIGGHANGKAIVPCINPEKLITAIVLGKRMDEGLKRRVIAMIETYGLGNKVCT